MKTQVVKIADKIDYIFDQNGCHQTFANNAQNS